MSHNPVPPPGSPAAGNPGFAGSFASPSGSPPGASTRLVVIAAVLALVAIVLINIYVEYVKRTSDLGEIVRYRLLATLRPGERLRDRDLEEVRLPRKYEEAFKNFLSPEVKDTRLGQMVLQTGTMGEFLSAKMFTQPENSTLDSEIGDGMRLYALPVNSRTAIGGLRPGMIVDIEAPFRVGGVLVVLPVMESVKIISVGNVSTADLREGSASRVSSYQNIGIEVTPQAATKLSMIDQIAQGPFELHLRKRGDTVNVKILNPDINTGINPAVLDMLPTPAAPSATPQLNGALEEMN